jgi:hypothetical protein
MLYLVQAHASMERANTADSGEGPGPVFAKVAERFRPEAFYGNPTRREIFMVVNLDTPAQMAELMYILSWVRRRGAHVHANYAARDFR